MSKPEQACGSSEMVNQVQVIRFRLIRVHALTVGPAETYHVRIEKTAEAAPSITETAYRTLQPTRVQTRSTAAHMRRSPFVHSRCNVDRRE